MATGAFTAIKNGGATAAVQYYGFPAELGVSEGVEEVPGQVTTVDESTVGALAEAHAEVESSESSEGYAEASPEALAAPGGGESAFSDLRPAGYEAGEAAGEAAGEQAPSNPPEAGTALEGGAEVLPFLVGLAAKFAPLLASSIGPAIARAVQNRLSARAKRVLAKPRTGGDVIAVLQTLLAQAMKRTEAAGEAAVDDHLVGELVEAMEVIIGTDDRLRINDTTKAPWRRHCVLRIEFPSGKVYRGTGFFIGERTLATAGHCVYLHEQGGWWVYRWRGWVGNGEIKKEGN